jgi:hypothetical protein
MEIERAARGSGDDRLRSRFDAAVYTIRRALALYPYVRAVALASLLCLHLHYITMALLQSIYYAYASSTSQLAGPCLDVKILHPKISHQIFRHMHGVLNKVYL